MSQAKSLGWFCSIYSFIAHIFFSLCFNGHDCTFISQWPIVVDSSQHNECLASSIIITEKWHGMNLIFDECNSNQPPQHLYSVCMSTHGAAVSMLALENLHTLWAPIPGCCTVQSRTSSLKAILIQSRFRMIYHVVKLWYFFGHKKCDKIRVEINRALFNSKHKRLQVSRSLKIMRCYVIHENVCTKYITIASIYLIFRSADNGMDSIS